MIPCVVHNMHSINIRRMNIILRFQLSPIYLGGRSLFSWINTEQSDALERGSWGRPSCTSAKPPSFREHNAGMEAHSSSGAMGPSPVTSPSLHGLPSA